MLRITRFDSPTEQRLIIEGRLTEPWIAGLNCQWEETRLTHPERKFVVDLRGVMRIDSGGEFALMLMKIEGAEFLASGIRIRQLVEDLDTGATETEASVLTGQSRPSSMLGDSTESPTINN